MVLLIGLLALGACKSDQAERKDQLAAGTTGKCPPGPPDTGPPAPVLVTSEPRQDVDGYHQVLFTQDGQWILARSRVVDVFAFDADSGKLKRGGWFGLAKDRSKPANPGNYTALTTWLADHEGVDEFVITPDSRWGVIAGSRTGTLTLFELDLKASSPGRPVASLPGLFRNVGAMALTPDGGWLVVGGMNPDKTVTAAEDQLLRLCRLSTRGKPALELTATLPFSQRLGDLAVSPDGRLVAAAGSNEYFRLFALDGSGGMREVYALEMADTLESVRFTPDGKHLLTAGFDQEVRVWKVEHQPTPHLELAHALHYHRAKTRDLAIAPDGRWLGVASTDKQLSLWPLALLTPESIHEPITFAPSNDFVFGMAIHPCRPWMVTAGDALRVWRLNRDELARGAGTRKRLVTDARALPWRGPDARLASWVSATELVTVSSFGEVATWQGTTQPVKSIRRAAEPSQKAWPPRYRSAVTTPDSVLLGGQDGQLRRVGRRGTKAEKAFAGHGKAVSSVAVAGKCVLSGASDGTAYAWQLDSEGGIQKTAELPTGIASIRMVALGPGGQVALTSGRHRGKTMFRIHRFDPRQCIPVGPPADTPAPQTPYGNLNHSGSSRDGQEPPVTAAFTKDGKWLLTGGSNGGSATLWRITEGRAEQRAFLPGHEYGVFTVAFSPNSRWIVTCGLEGQSILWRFDPEKGKATRVEYLRQPANPPNGFPHSVSWSPDSRRFAIAAGHSRIGRVWLYTMPKSVEASK